VIKKHLRCAGYVLAGIGFVMGFFIAALAAAGGVIWLSIATASLFGLPDWAAGPINLGYIAAIVGAVIGVAWCREFA
jgi:hypothetical protein